jgi:hypothetical protein
LYHFAKSAVPSQALAQVKTWFMREGKAYQECGQRQAIFQFSLAAAGVYGWAMLFTCPHCHKTFEQKLRAVDTSPTATAKRRRVGKITGTLGGRPSFVSDEAVEHVFLEGQSKGTVWTGESFGAAIKKATGKAYSRTQSFTLLRQVKAKHPALASQAGTAKGLVRNGYKAVDKLPTQKRNCKKAKTG